MTTRSIHAYVLGSLAKLGLDETQVTKFQTGGPDGDLGSNEILISKDRTIGIVDGGGVLYDPNGLDRAELVRVARLRQLSRSYDRSKLSAAGWYIDCEHTDLAVQNAASTWPLPADVVAQYASGIAVRNLFHLSPLARADLFVPCGGRPRAVDLNNVAELLPNNVPRYKRDHRGREPLLHAGGAPAPREGRLRRLQGRQRQQGRRDVVVARGARRARAHRRRVLARTCAVADRARNGAASSTQLRRTTCIEHHREQRRARVRVHLEREHVPHRPARARCCRTS
jgi:hypothetical protein